jgi:hypothetical protein
MGDAAGRQTEDAGWVEQLQITEVQVLEALMKQCWEKPVD